MPFCGFNDKMLNGLEEFTQGLVEHGLIDRSENSSHSIEEILNKELADMFRMLEEVSKINETEKKILTEGLLKYSLAVYLIIRKSQVSNYDIIANSISEYFKSMDDIYYSKLEGHPNDMRDLVELLNKIKIETEPTNVVK